jgi:transcriptional repressor NrdR
LVSKRDGRREEFSSDKLLNSIRLACAKRPLQSGSIDKIVAEIDSRIQESGKAEIPSATIGELVVQHLKKLDRVAYIRFASVYRDFADIETFRQEVNSLIKTTETKQRTSEDQLALFPLDIPLQLTRRRPRKQKK